LTVGFLDFPILTTNQFCIYAVDDDDDDRFLIQRALLSYSDCAVTFFEQGHSLLAALTQQRPDQLPTLILLDLDMPGMNGYDVLKTIRNNAALRAIPVLVLSGTCDEYTVVRAYELGANSFMSKPDTVSGFETLFQSTYAYWLQTAHTPRHS
jgi:CheY-like chemotaxis protein